MVFGRPPGFLGNLGEQTAQLLELGGVEAFDLDLGPVLAQTNALHVA
jgi:hypothetical protein